jgi:hypothetical protein
MWTEAAVACLETIAQDVPGETEEATVNVRGHQDEAGISSFPHVTKESVCYSLDYEITQSIQ